MSINGFRGKYSFLSNFYECMMYGEISTVEHHFQAAKVFDPVEKYKILSADTPGQAKRLGRKVNLRHDWGLVNRSIMLELLREKFSDRILALELMETGKHELIEENNWGDTNWGVCNGIGHNNLGILLMQVRDELMLNELRRKMS